MNSYRVGFGVDLHRFSKKKKDLILGGVKIDFNLGLEAVSDGDVVLHAVSDAVCGACCLGDIGDYFPPSSKKSKDIDSKKIVNFVLDKINEKFRIINVDITIIADKPKLSERKNDILKSLRKIFAVEAVNIKIKSKEGGSFFGDKDSIASLAAVLVKEIIA